MGRPPTRFWIEIIAKLFEKCTDSSVRVLLFNGKTVAVSDRVINSKLFDFVDETVQSG